MTALNNLFDCFNFKLFGITFAAMSTSLLSHFK